MSLHAFEIGPAKAGSKLTFLKETLNWRYLKRTVLQMVKFFQEHSQVNKDHLQGIVYEVSKRLSIYVQLV